MRRSLQQHLSVALGIAILLTGLVAAAASFALAYSEAKDFQDDMLRQIAILLAGGTSNLSATQQIDGMNDPESRVTIYRFPGSTAPAWLNSDLPAGLHTLNADSGRMRVFVHRGQMRIIVVQPTDARDEIAINSALRILIPLLLLLPLLIWLIVRIVRNQLAPVAKLAGNLDEQSPHHPHPLQSDDLPDEIVPFVDAINRLLKKVHHLLAQQRRFIADAAHELRTPLAALSIQSQNLLQAQSPEEMRERVEPLCAGIARARHLTEQLLNLAQTQAGTAGDSTVDVSTMARELIAEYLPLAEARHIDLGMEEITALTLSAAPDALRLIIRNGLENALKYTPAGGEVTLRLDTVDGHAIIEIIDNGPGISAAERERVFDPFYRLPGAVGEGSGLGLAIAREAAIRLNGVVSLHEPRQGSGLIFRYRHA